MVITEEKLQPLHHGLPTWSCARSVLRRVSSAGGVLMALLLWRNVLVRFCHSHWISRWNHWMALFPNRLQNPPVQRWAGCAQLWSLSFVFFSHFFFFCVPGIPCSRNSQIPVAEKFACGWWPTLVKIIPLGLQMQHSGLQVEHHHVFFSSMALLMILSLCLSFFVSEHTHF